jgi:hypothetical protein
MFLFYTFPSFTCWTPMLAACRLLFPNAKSRDLSEHFTGKSTLSSCSQNLSMLLLALDD